MDERVGMGAQETGSKYTSGFGCATEAAVRTQVVSSYLSELALAASLNPHTQRCTYGASRQRSHASEPASEQRAMGGRQQRVQAGPPAWPRRS